MRDLLSNTKTAAILSLGLLGLALLSSCDANGYCIDCTEAEITNIDAAPVTDFDAAPLSDAGDGDACVSSGPETCDGTDNDCDGEIDEGDLPGVGATCGSNEGLCEEGLTVCTEGALACGGVDLVTPTFELCNLIDDDCDGVVDENNPEGGLICGTNQGECEAGVQTCTGGAITCLGQVTGSVETCNGLDDDCDGLFDEGITTAGNCGPASDMGLCSFGTNTCIGGGMQCVGAVLPTLEQCDNIDHDCDGNPSNGYNLVSDAQNCGSCGNVCSAPRAFMACSNSSCEIAACDTNYFDLNAEPGCEYGPCTFRGSEICNGIDDDCDGEIDEGVNAFAPLCDQDGECSSASATATCVSGSYVCSYGPNVTVDGDGAIVPESDCDGLDNDCDGQTDEAFVNLGLTCDDGELGQCRDTGVFVCNGSQDGTVCDAVDDPNDNPPPTEICNNVDDDCDGLVDENERDWVDIGGGVEIMQHEASRPDSTSTEQGFITDASVCSDANRMPWTNITQPDAQLACERIGADLCTEATWLRACETDNLSPTTESGSDGVMMVEVEDMTRTGGADHDWVNFTDIVSFSGSAYLKLEPDAGESTAGTLDEAARLDQAFTISNAGDKYIWIRIWADQSADNDFYVGFDGDTAGAEFIDLTTYDSWRWRRSSAFNLSAASHTVNIYGGDGGVIVDRVVVTSDADYVPLNAGPPTQCQWSYNNDCRVYQADTCNGEDYDGDAATAGDQDIVLATGSMNACYAEWEAGGDAFDLSGNVKEWTAARASDVNPIRGGSFNNTAIGTSCQFDFLTADDSFFLPNIGFRCCR